MRAAAFAAIVLCALVARQLPAASQAANHKVLQRVRGVVGFSRGIGTADFVPVFGTFDLPDEYSVITREQSAALHTFPDSSIVGLGENTRILAGAFFQQTAAGPNATLLVMSGTLRFEVHVRDDETPKYQFLTPTAVITVRGAVGLLSALGGKTSIVCLVCAPGTVTVSPAGLAPLRVLTGQIMTVFPTKVVETGQLTETELAAFRLAGVSTAVDPALRRSLAEIPDTQPTPDAECDVPASAARVIRVIQPALPAVAMQQGVSGTVVVQVNLDENSKIVSATIKDTPSPLLNNAALTAAKESSYQTAISGCQPVADSIDVRFVFGR